ncbi:MAG: bifunctional diaminohydroxyphosphoribosylaminopyrimidine deaminase/5-amino-6-(5-phosphoribosylamino)uracil reductase RibD [Vicingus serpentipes]|nr:bifunctional diaminohydroxyphosphoribosylaminopyrimidine deaminase/5-amino-6-(5-phosphoribosylamino)uracil reductase RibD [Vicingus serpentipes]
MMNIHEKYVFQCLKKAELGFGNVAPNPMVGCLIVHKNKIVGQGYHEKYGENHAEVNAINSVKNKELLKESTLYVNLEPCAHHGKTPPCADLIIKHQIPKVVIGCVDTFSEVSGKGIEKMKNAGIEVIVGVLEKEAKELNKRFFTFHNKKRPYIILKWAETTDGFIDVDRSNQNNTLQDNWITSPTSKKLVHQWRSEEQAIMVGTNTALNDNSQLNVREVEGKNPLRVVLDLKLRLPHHLHIFDQSTPTLIINQIKNNKQNNLEFIKIDTQQDLINQLLKELYNRNIQSIIIEGGAQLLNTFIESSVWDEARVFTGNKKFKKGLKAPSIKITPLNKLQFDADTLTTYINA